MINEINGSPATQHGSPANTPMVASDSTASRSVTSQGSARSLRSLIKEIEFKNKLIEYAETTIRQNDKILSLLEMSDPERHILHNKTRDYRTKIHTLEKEVAALRQELAALQQ